MTGDETEAKPHWLDVAVRDAAARELPLEVKKAAVRGLGIASLVGATVVAAYVVAMGVEGLREPGAGVAGHYVAAVWSILVLDLFLFFTTRAKSVSASVVLRLGLVHFVAVALLLGIVVHSHPGVEAAAQAWSPVAVWILLFGALVPMRPGMVLGWSLVAALMDPIAFWAVRDRVVEREASAGFVLASSPLLAALIAYVTSRVVYGLTERVVAAREFGSYRLAERLGAGGIAEVWRADHRMLARPAALKLIRPSVLETYGERETTRLVRLFEREVQATAGLRSAHTIQIYDFGIARDGTFYYVMELLDGFDLQTLVERFGRQPPERVVHILQQACRSLHEAHTRLLVHRDVKPGNIYLCRYGVDLDFAKLLDFGLVLDRRPTVEELDDRRAQIGTPAVMAPEQIRFDAPIDQRADLYALGCVAYWLLTGTRVFEAESRQDMLVMHAHQRPDPPSRRAKVDFPEALERLVMQCLEKNPNLRPQSSMGLLESLSTLSLPEKWTRERMEAWWAGAADNA